MVDCSPPWAFRPTFTSGTPTFLQSFEELRSRKGAGGTFFRSAGVGSDKNNIEIEVLQVVSTFTLNVYVDGVLEETYGPTTQTELVGPPITCSPNLIDTFRGQVNSNSNFIEMPFVDYGGAPDGMGGTPSFDSSMDDADCLSPFPRGFLSGGDGGPTDGTGLGTIKTGHQRSMIAIQTTELINDDFTDTGESFLPTPTRRIQQWDGFAWVAYIPGTICP